MGMAAADAGMASAALSQYAAQEEDVTLERGIADGHSRPVQLRPVPHSG